MHPRAIEHPLFFDGRIHLSGLQAEDRIREEDWSIMIGEWRRANMHVGLAKELAKVRVCSIVGFVLSSETREIVNAPKVLTDDQDFGSWTSEPLRPVANDRRIEIKFGTILDEIRIGVAAGSARSPLFCQDLQCCLLSLSHTVACLPESAQRSGNALAAFFNGAALAVRTGNIERPPNKPVSVRLDDVSFLYFHD